MSDDELENRIEAAIRRGRQRNVAAQKEAEKVALTEEELRRLHTSHRLTLSDRIENAIDRIASHFPGFQKETLFGENGWGAACSRDDLNLRQGRRSTRFSRLEMTIRPLNEYMVLELKSKATVANKEVFNRNHFVELSKVEIDDFERLIDQWVIEYAELFAAQG